MSGIDSMTTTESGASPRPPLVVDVHTHIYPDFYVDLLSRRNTVPYIHRPLNGPLRLIILPSDDDHSLPLDQRGRPIDETYTSWSSKLEFMRAHGIDASIVSLANPWLDFLDSDEAAGIAGRVNDELEQQCCRLNSSTLNGTDGRSFDSSAPTSRMGPKVFAFGVLPLSAPVDRIVSEIEQLTGLEHIKGVIMGTTGLGNGLDSSSLDRIWSALEETQTMVFLHPHYGLPIDAFGGGEVSARYGHVLPLALGFPMETTIAITRAYLSGVFDRHPRLKILLAHAGGTLPFLAGRIQSCVEHERHFLPAGGGQIAGPKRSVWDVLSTNIWLDAATYGSVGVDAAASSSAADRIMFGTDHPFFPPLQADMSARWASVDSNLKGIAGSHLSEAQQRSVLGENANRVFDLGL